MNTIGVDDGGLEPDGRNRLLAVHLEGRSAALCLANESMRTMMRKAGGKVYGAKMMEVAAPPRNVTLIGGPTGSGRISVVVVAGLDGGKGLQEILRLVAAK